MSGVKRFIYSLIGITIFVILPGFFIISYHMEKGLPGNDYLVTRVSGPAFVQYQVRHPLSIKSDRNAVYQKTSQWIPLRKGMKIGTGVLINLKNQASLDIMKKKDVALRIKEDSLLSLEINKAAPTRIDATLNYGKILCRITAAKSKGEQKGPEIFRVITPTATTHVRGTSFSVDYRRDKKITNVGVLEGLVAVESKKLPKMEFNVPKGKNLYIAPFQRVPVLDYLTPALLQELQETQNLQTSLSLSDRWEDVLQLVTNSPLYNKALSEITKYEMKVFFRAILYFAPLRWKNSVPKSLKSVELEDGDYKDPWGIEYYYERLGSKKAILISAGPDKVLHTKDDIFIAINL